MQPPNSNTDMWTRVRQVSKQNKVKHDLSRWHYQRDITISKLHRTLLKPRTKLKGCLECISLHSGCGTPHEQVLMLKWDVFMGFWKLGDAVFLIKHWGKKDLLDFQIVTFERRDAQRNATRVLLQENKIDQSNSPRTRVECLCVYQSIPTRSGIR